MIYLDYAATAPIDEAVVAAMAEASRRWANPSSVHGPGRAARAALEAARAEVAAALGWQGAVIFTSGGTEALAIALGQARTRSRLVSAVEHVAVLGRAAGATIIPVDGAGRVDLDALRSQLEAAAAPALVAVMHANNETGVLQPIAEVAGLVRAAGGTLLSDCVQTAGKLPLPDADLIAVSAHKLGGPPGIGALLVRDPAMLDPAQPTGGQERSYRTGTENLVGACGFAAALAARAADPDWPERAARLLQRLECDMTEAGGSVIAADAERLPTIACVRLPGVEAMQQLMSLDLAGMAVSAGAACSSGRVGRSHVLMAMGLDEMAAKEAIRVSVGWATTEAECDGFVSVYRDMTCSMINKTR